LWNDSFNTNKRKNTFVIMAGGQGKRLRPYTENCPKPMIEIEGKPMLEHILYRAKLEGFQNFIISINYLGQIIKDYFGDGSRHNINIKYVNEDLPLGTAGSLSLLELPDEPFLVSNGDIITDISYGNLLDFHIKHNAVATMAIKIHQWQNPFGIVSMDGIVIKGFEEKPIIKSQVNAGVYALSKDSLDSLIKNEKCDMPDLFLKLKSQKKLTIGYPIHEHWKDIGRPDDLKTFKLNS
ncbi:sugar phosphate nucleotidyltransferase, partial [Prochlorococcus sp. AH-736-A21]|nr:sugar phosphate nucleotidyltransferase [Prochlorococcus sp. AH-736-A21]